MQQIVDWLEKLGMSEYAQRFAENRIDFSVLRELTDQDLKELGVVLGDRRKMLCDSRYRRHRERRTICSRDCSAASHTRNVRANLDRNTTADLRRDGGRRRAPLCHGDVL
jgi:SAM domain (Sterile alpha motif)